MKQIKILGTGCPKCKQTETAVRDYLKLHHVDAEVTKVVDIMDILKYNPIATPAVVVEGEVKIYGKIPSHPEIEEALK
jgi:small redox-active disulfide protein 2